MASTEGTHSDILAKLHEKEMQNVKLTAERDTLQSALDGKLVEYDRLKENNRILTSRLEQRDAEIHELTREKGGLEESSKKALALAIQQLEMEVKAKEIHQDTVRKMTRQREEDGKKLATMSQELSERVSTLDQLEEARYREEVSQSS